MTPETIAASLTPAQVRALTSFGSKRFIPWSKAGGDDTAIHDIQDLGLAKWIPAIIGEDYLQITPLGLTILAALDKGAGE